MAFWGIEVKPGKPFTLSHDIGRGRLHISQATLAIGSSKTTSLVQCNVGSKSPVLLCALLPDKAESLQLNLEFEEAEEVVFSVIGPRGVHLTGFYVDNSRRSALDDESESYGEDIANSDNEGYSNCSEEDEYEDSFIDDDDPEALPPSPISTDGVDEVAELKKPGDKRRTHKRLKKKYQSVESEDDDTSSWKPNTANCIINIAVSDDEDNFPISSLCMSKRTATNVILETPPKTKNCDDYMAESKGKFDTPVKDDKPKRTKKKTEVVSNEGKTLDVDADAVNNKKAEDKAQQGNVQTNKISQDPLVSNEPDHEPDTNKTSDLPNNSSLPSTNLDPENGIKPKRKRKKSSKEGKILDADNGSLTENKAPLVDEADDMDHNLPVSNEHDQTPTSNMEIGVSPDTLMPSVEEGSEKIHKKKKRRKTRAVEKADEDDVREDRSKQDEVKIDSTDKDLPVTTEQDQKLSGDKNIVSDKIADENTSEKSIKKKKKKKSKIQDTGANVNVEANERTVKEPEVKNVDIGSSQGRTLSNGLIIEELESGRSDGKAAAPGRKVKVLYTAKLKESGQIIDTNIGKAPYRFRLGDQQVMEGWNVGLDGMRVGDKRRLSVPPSVGDGSRGIGENAPPNSWLVYDIELLNVH